MAIVIHYVTIIVPVLTAISGIVAFNADNNRTICEENFLRQMRGIVWPPFTVFQFAVGLAVPAQVPNRTIFTNWGILNNVPLPAKVEQLYLKLPETRKHMRKYTHQNLYQFLENVFGKWNGDVLKSSTRTKSQNIKAPTSQCVLRSICLATSLENNGKKELIYQIMKLLFLPSNIKNSVAEMPYIIAERTGKRSSPDQRIRNCFEAYPLCSMSVFETIFENIQFFLG